MSSTLKVDNITNVAGTGSPSFPNGLLGVGSGLQWQNVTSSRSPNVVYQNTVGQLILVAAQINGGVVEGSPDSVTWTTIIPRPGNYNSFFAVAPGSYYRFTGLTITYWAELR